MEQQARGISGRITGAVILLPITLGMYWLAAFVLFQFLRSLGFPVGARKLAAFCLMAVPASLAGLGWVQGRGLFIVHLIGAISIWIGSVGFALAFQPYDHVVGPEKMMATAAYFMDFFVYIACAIISALWNTIAFLKGEEIRLRIPFRKHWTFWPQ